MRLDEFTFIPYEVREKALQYLANALGRPDADLQQLMAELDRSLAQRVAQNELTYLAGEQFAASEAEADGVCFKTGLTTPTGEEILAKATLNKRPGARQRWFGLFFETARRPGYHIGDISFKTWGDGARFLEEVAAMAIPEKWTYSEYASRQNFPILKSFIEKTYERVKQQEKVVRTDRQVLFNTGLINSWFKEIYVACDVDPENPNRLVNPRPVLENDRVVLETFENRKPAMATFFTRIADVIFDPDLEVNTDDQHILDDNYERIPEEYRKMKKSLVFALFQSAIEFARIMARRNYKMIVPQFFNGKIQFLMPIYLSGELDGQPDFALALEKINNCYRGNTILTLDMAYQNARLIAKPDTTWLNPENGA